MITAELGLATASAATLSGSTAMKTLAYYGSRQASLGGTKRAPPSSSIWAMQSCGSPLQRFAEHIFIF